MLSNLHFTHLSKINLLLQEETRPNHYVVISNLIHGNVYSVSATNKTDGHDITEILLKVTLNTITKTPQYIGR
jgi:hypothetical protein